MPLSTLELNTISTGIQAAKDLLSLYERLHRLNIVFDSLGGVKSTITQEGLNAVASFSGLTVQQLDDAFYVLTATVRTNIETGFSPLATLAARS